MHFIALHGTSLHCTELNCAYIFIQKYSASVEISTNVGLFLFIDRYRKNMIVTPMYFCLLTVIYSHHQLLTGVKSNQQLLTNMYAKILRTTDINVAERFRQLLTFTSINRQFKTITNSYKQSAINCYKRLPTLTRSYKQFPTITNTYQ